MLGMLKTECMPPNMKKPRMHTLRCVLKLRPHARKYHGKICSELTTHAPQVKPCMAPEAKMLYAPNQNLGIAPQRKTTHSGYC